MKFALRIVCQTSSQKQLYHKWKFMANKTHINMLTKVSLSECKSPSRQTAKEKSPCSCYTGSSLS